MKRKSGCEIYGLPFSGDFDEIELYSDEQEPIQPTADEFSPTLPSPTPTGW